MKTDLTYKWLKRHPGFAYFAGDVSPLPEKAAKPLLKGGFIERYVAPKPVPPKTDLPDDFPGRDALVAHGLLTLEEARQIKDFTEIRGIGKSTNKMILDYLKNLKK
jgi:hypothetical protein